MARLRGDGRTLRKIDRARLAFRRKFDALAVGDALTVAQSIGMAWLTKVVHRRNTKDPFGFVSLRRDPDLKTVTLTYQRKEQSYAN